MDCKLGHSNVQTETNNNQSPNKTKRNQAGYYEVNI